MRRDEAYMLDMLIAARDTASFISGLTREQFETSRLHQLAVMKALETIGEAATKVSEASRADHPEIPWREIIGMRHRLVHGYFEVDLEKVWDTAQTDIPALINAIEPWLPPEEV